MEKNKAKIRTIIIAVMALAVLTATGIFVYQKFFNKADADNSLKTITVEIVFSEENKKVVEITTEAEFLRGALEEKGLIEGSESAYCFYVTTVDGVLADESKRQWWCFTKGGAELNVGVDQIPIEDGDNFEITLSVY